MAVLVYDFINEFADMDFISILATQREQIYKLAHKHNMYVTSVICELAQWKGAFYDKTQP